MTPEEQKLWEATHQKLNELDDNLIKLWKEIDEHFCHPEEDEDNRIS